MRSLDKYFEKANLLYDNEDYDHALEIYNDLYDNGFDNSKILPYIICSYLAKGEFDKLVKYFEKYSELDLSEEEINRFLEESFKIYDSLNLTDYSLYINKAQFLIKFGRFTQALDYLNKSIEINPNDFRCLNLKAFVQYSLGQYDQSLNTFNEVLEIDNLNYDALKFKAQILYSLDDDEKAMDVFKKALAVNNSDLFVWREYISSCIFSGHIHRALAEVNNALKLFPSNIQLLLDKFDILMFSDNVDDAKVIADEVADKYPDIVDDYLNNKNDLLNDDLISLILENKPYNNGSYILESNFFDRNISEDLGKEDIYDEDIDIDRIILDLLNSISEDENSNVDFDDLLSLFLFSDMEIDENKRDDLLNYLSSQNTFAIHDEEDKCISDYETFYEDNLKKTVNGKLFNAESDMIESDNNDYNDEFIIKTIFDDYNIKYSDKLCNILLKASLLFDFKKYTDAYGYIDKADILFPKNINILLLKAGILLYLEEYDNSLRYVNMALILDKYSFIGWVFKGYIHIYLKDIFNGLQSFNVALSIDKTDKTLWRIYELTLISISSYNLALNINKQGLNIFPDDEELWCDRLFLLNQLGDFISDDYNEALKYCSDLNKNSFSAELKADNILNSDYLKHLMNLLFSKFEDI